MDATAVAGPAQNMRALALANRVRLARAELKRQIGEGRQSVVEVLTSCPWEAEGMSVSDLLLTQHRWGRIRCRRLLASIPLPETKKIGSLTDRQRQLLVARLKGHIEHDAVFAPTSPIRATRTPTIRAARLSPR